MKKFTKALTSIAGTLFSLAFIGVIIAFCMGATKIVIPFNFNYNSQSKSFKTANCIIYDLQNHKWYIDNNYLMHSNNIVNSQNKPFATSTTQLSTNANVDEIDLDISAAEVKIIKGDDFKVEYENFENDQPPQYSTDGKTFAVQSDEESTGINLNQDRKITITIPSATYKKIDMNFDACKVTCEPDLQCDEFNISLNMGSVVIDSLIVNSETQTECNAGAIKISGEIYGDTQINCNMGSIEYFVKGKLSNYKYDVDCGLGAIKLDKKSFNSLGTGKTTGNKDAENSLDVECNVGSVVVKFD